MHLLWRGSINFGLVNIPVELYSALSHQEISFHLLHRKCHTRLEYKRFCPKCQIEVPWEEVIRGYEYAKSNRGSARELVRAQEKSLF